MMALALLLVTASPQEPDLLRAEISRLKSEVAELNTAVRERDELLGSVRESLRSLHEGVAELRERPTRAVAAAFLAAPPAGSDRLGVARTAVFAPRIEVDSALRHDTVSLKVKRVEAEAVRTVAELELTPDLNGIDLPLDQSGALFLVEWSTSEGHVYNLVLRDGASGQPAASVPVKEKQNEGRFALVGYRVE
jgi:hypothetical protein